MSDKNGKPRSRAIDSLTEDDATLLRRLVQDHLPAGVTVDAALLISRLIANIGQRERLLGRLQDRLEHTEARAQLAENTIRSMKGNGDDARKRTRRMIRQAVDGAQLMERRRIVAWLRRCAQSLWAESTSASDAVRNAALAIDKMEHLIKEDA
jgi:hypothetical protein